MHCSVSAVMESIVELVVLIKGVAVSTNVTFNMIRVFGNVKMLRHCMEIVMDITTLVLSTVSIMRHWVRFR